MAIFHCVRAFMSPSTDGGSGHWRSSNDRDKFQVCICVDVPGTFFSVHLPDFQRVKKCPTESL